MVIDRARVGQPGTPMDGFRVGMSNRRRASQPKAQWIGKHNGVRCASYTIREYQRDWGGGGGVTEKSH